MVSEAALNSNSLITAGLAAEQGREVFAVRKTPLDSQARVLNDLLRKGASLCEQAKDIFDDLKSIMG